MQKFHPDQHKEYQNQSKKSDKSSNSTDSDSAKATKMHANTDRTPKSTNPNADWSQLKSRSCIILFENYFHLLSTNPKGVLIGECRFCKQPKIVKGLLRHRGNFTGHLAVSTNLVAKIGYIFHNSGFGIKWRNFYSIFSLQRFHKQQYTNYKIEATNYHISNFNPVTKPATPEQLDDLPNAIRVLLGKYFQLLSRGDGSLYVKCNFCKPDRHIKGDERITSNYTRHLKVSLSRELNSFRCKWIFLGNSLKLWKISETYSNFSIFFPQN